MSSGGIRYEADHYFTGGQITNRPGVAVAATVDDSLYQSERSGSFSYAIPLTSGVYEVYFDFAELALAREKSLVFAVHAEGKELIKSLDVYAQAGFQTAYRVSHTLLVKDGVLNLDFESLIGQAQLSGLVIEGKTEVGGGGRGLSATYFNNMDFTGTHFSRRDVEIDFDWSRTAPHRAIEPETYSTRWTGQVHAQYSQTYTFYTQTDDGVRLWVNGVPLIDHWNSNSTGVTEQSGTITLKAGQQYDIKMEYYQHTGEAIAKLFWSSASQPKQIIPQKRLSPGAGPVTNQVTAQLEGDGLSAELSVTLSPNPANQITRLQLKITGQEKVLVVIYNTLSKEVMRVEKTLQAGEDLPLTVHQLQAGTYMIAVRQGNRISVKKLIVSR